MSKNVYRQLTNVVVGVSFFCFVGLPSVGAQATADDVIRSGLLRIIDSLVSMRDNIQLSSTSNEAAVSNALLGSRGLTITPRNVQRSLSTFGLTVQEGKAIPFTIDDCANVTDCFGNNASSPYMLFALPAHPNKPNNIPDSLVGPVPGVPSKMSINYLLNKNEGMIIIGVTPPEVAYFGLTPYIYSRVDNNGVPQPIFASTGDSLNHHTLNTVTGRPYSSWFATVYASDVNVVAAAKSTLKQYGFTDATINVVPLSRSQIKFGQNKNTQDTFSVIGRMALPTNQAAYDAWENTGQMYVFRVTADTPTSKQVPVPPRTPKGDGVSEAKYSSGLNSLDAVLVNRLRNQSNVSSVKRIPIVSPSLISDVIDPDECIANVTECLGDNGDTTYAAGPVEAFTNVKLKLDGNDSIYVYGVNHEHVGKAEYSAVSLYLSDRRTGIAGVSSKQMLGSAKSYVGSNPNRYFVWEFTRNCHGRTYCTAVPYSFPGASKTDDLNFIFRAYINPGQTVSADPSEMLAERAVLVVR